jgi:hypothetical protein
MSDETPVSQPEVASPQEEEAARADPPAQPVPEEEHEPRCTLCGLRACWTG